MARACPDILRGNFRLQVPHREQNVSESFWASLQVQNDNAPHHGFDDE